MVKWTEKVYPLHQSVVVSICCLALKISMFFFNVYNYFLPQSSNLVFSCESLSFIFLQLGARVVHYIMLAPRRR